MTATDFVTDMKIDGENCLRRFSGLVDNIVFDIFRKYGLSNGRLAPTFPELPQLTALILPGNMVSGFPANHIFHAN